jgi:hypothetical protein
VDVLALQVRNLSLVLKEHPTTYTTVESSTMQNRYLQSIPRREISPRWISDTRLRFPDGFRSLAGCAAATSPAVPSAKTCCFFSSFKTMFRTLLSLAGFQVIITGRFWVIAEAIKISN